MTDAQTEARAIAQAREIILKAPVNDWDRIIELIAAALAAKDAELAIQREAKEHARRECERAEAALAEAQEEISALRGKDIANTEARLELADQLAEARKALEPFARAADNFDGFKITNEDEWFAYGGSQSAEKTTGAITVADLRAARFLKEKIDAR